MTVTDGGGCETVFLCFYRREKGSFCITVCVCVCVWQSISLKLWEIAQEYIIPWFCVLTSPHFVRDQLLFCAHQTQNNDRFWHRTWQPGEQKILTENLYFFRLFVLFSSKDREKTEVLFRTDQL